LCCCVVLLRCVVACVVACVVLLLLLLTCDTIYFMSSRWITDHWATCNRPTSENYDSARSDT
jgi:hypothetical protein